MKTWHVAVMGLLLLATAGCRSDPKIAVLERELRRKEDKIYRLQWAIEDMQDALDCRDDWQSKSSQPEVAPPRRADSGVPNGARPPAIELPSRPSEGVPEHLRVPSAPPAPGGDGPALEKGLEAPPSRPGEGGVSADIPLPEATLGPSGDSRQVAAIVLNRMMTGGINLDGRSGDQGLLAVVEPRDAAGRPLDAPAAISVVVLDPAIADAEGKAVRLARWEFTAAETAELFRRAGSSRAIHLMMAWPDEPPKHNNLHLFVRYVTADGRKLQADMPFEIALPGEQTSRWTPAELDRTEQRIPALESRRVDQPPTARIPGPPPRMAARQREPKPKRPVWSPERPQ